MPSVWTMSCILAGSVVILVFSNFSVNPVKRITCSVVSFLLAGPGLLGGLAALAGSPWAAWPQIPKIWKCPQFLSAPFPFMNVGFIMLWRRTKTTGAHGCVLRSASAPFHTFLAKSWFVYNVVKHRLTQCRHQKWMKTGFGWSLLSP